MVILVARTTTSRREIEMIFRSRKDEGMAHDTAAPFVEAPVGTPLQATRRSLLLGAAAAAVTSKLSASAPEAAMAAATGPEIAAAEREWLELWKRGPTRVRWTSLPVQPGDKAPDLELADSSGSIVRLSDTWQGGPTIIVFLRHFGCSCARDRVARLKQEHADYLAAGAKVVAVGQGEPARARRFALLHGLPCPLLCDPARRAYEAYGLLEGRPSQVVYGMPDEFLRCDVETGAEFQASRRGTQSAAVDNPFQLPGEFVVDPQGLLCLTYRSQYCADFAEPQVLVAAIKEARLGLKYG
jgi:peroxiredoxin